MGERGGAILRDLFLGHVQSGRGIQSSDIPYLSHTLLSDVNISFIIHGCI